MHIGGWNGYRRSWRNICLVACVAALSACLGKRLTLPAALTLPQIEPAAASSPVAGGNISLDQVSDARRAPEIVTHDGRALDAAGDVGRHVRSALERTFIDSGLFVSDSAPVVLSAEIRSWHAEISGSSSPRADTEASIFLKVFDPANKMIYSGSYRGNANLQKVNMTEEDVREVLATAMHEALVQISKDTQLLKLLSSF